MKRFADLTDAEVLALTEDQVQRFIDLECAEEGVPLSALEVPPEPPPLQAVRDAKLYSVAGIYLASRIEAERLAEVLVDLDRYSVEYPGGGSWENRVARPLPDRAVKVEVELHWSPVGWERHRDAVSRHDQLKAAHAQALKAHQRARQARRGIAEPIQARLNAIHQKEARRQELARELERYTELADGNREVAQRFLEKAHPGALVALGLADGPALALVPVEPSVPAEQDEHEGQPF